MKDTLTCLVEKAVTAFSKWMQTSEYFERRRHLHGIELYHVYEAGRNEVVREVQRDGPEGSMKLEYFADTDTLSILLNGNPGEVDAEDTNDPDITLLYDATNRIAEILIEHAAHRIDLDSIRREIGFEIVGDPEPTA